MRGPWHSIILSSWFGHNTNRDFNKRVYNGFIFLITNVLFIVLFLFSNQKLLVLFLPWILPLQSWTQCRYHSCSERLSVWSMPCLFWVCPLHFTSWALLQRAPEDSSWLDGVSCDFLLVFLLPLASLFLICCLRIVKTNSILKWKY